MATEASGQRLCSQPGPMAAQAQRQGCCRAPCRPRRLAPHPRSRRSSSRPAGQRGPSSRRCAPTATSSARTWRTASWRRSWAHTCQRGAAGDRGSVGGRWGLVRRCPQEAGAGTETPRMLQPQCCTRPRPCSSSSGGGSSPVGHGQRLVHARGAGVAVHRLRRTQHAAGLAQARRRHDAAFGERADEGGGWALGRRERVPPQAVGSRQPARPRAGGAPRPPVPHV